MIDLFFVDASTPPLFAVADDLRAQVRVDDVGENSLLMAQAMAAQMHIERVTGRRLTERTATATVEAWAVYRLMAAPCTVTAVGYTDAVGAPAVLPETDWVVRPWGGDMALLRLAVGASAPTLGDDGVISVTATLGYAENDCPEPLRLAALLLTGHWYRNREAVVVGVASAVLPKAVDELIAPYRVSWLA